MPISHWPASGCQASCRRSDFDRILQKSIYRLQITLRSAVAALLVTLRGYFGGYCRKNVQGDRVRVNITHQVRPRHHGLPLETALQSLRNCSRRNAAALRRRRRVTKTATGATGWRGLRSSKGCRRSRWTMQWPPVDGERLPASSVTNVRDQGSSSVTLYVCGSRACLAHRTHTSPGRTVERAWCGPTLHGLVVRSHSQHALYCTLALLRWWCKPEWRIARRASSRS